MTPRALELVLQVIHEVNLKTVSEARDDAWIEGRAEGRAEAQIEIENEVKETAKEIAKNLRNSVDLEELSKATGLTIEEIKKL